MSVLPLLLLFLKQASWRREPGARREEEKGRKRGKERARVSTNQAAPDRCWREDSEVGGFLVCVGVCLADSSFSSCKSRGGRMLGGEVYIRVRMHWPGGRGPI